MLKCETNTPEMAGRILNAAYIWAAYAFTENPTGPFDVYFEHGQWWLFDIANDRTFSVCDAEADTVAREQELGIVDGFCFEEV